MRRNLWVVPLFTLAMGACNDASNPEGELNENEVITTVVATFTPQSGGTALVYRWADPENDGDPVVDAIELSDAEDYTLGVQFLNELEDPPEDITLEVDAESDVHQVFFFGTAVAGPATGPNPEAVVTQAYADSDTNGLPVGLENTIVTDTVGTGTFTVLLRHMPPESETAVKVAGLAEDAATNGFDALPGDTDAEVGFDLVVE